MTLLCDKIAKRSWSLTLKSMQTVIQGILFTTLKNNYKTKYNTTL